MTTLADLKTNDQFIFANLVTNVDPTNGISLSLYGPGRVLAATATIAPSGAMTGTLAVPPTQVPVNLVTGFAPVSVGDVLENRDTGETAVCRWTQINPDGTVYWSSSSNHKVVYSGDRWSVIGHCDGIS